ncbi:MAG: ectonucleotide pyrophosphatase/phosphodiesterase [Pseudomonadota bacterium]|nr:ectonucleotide pyrophosphatase/phosphodiesterase [Pseudomonadota bacterium]
MTTQRLLPFSLPALFFVFLAACAPATRPPVERDSVLLVSLDGFRPDYLDLGITPNLSRLAREGVRADWMKTSYPSLTFPNHYTLVTGLRPDRHGIVHNTMRDAELGDFALSKRDALGDGRWWAGEPIWVGAAKAGLPSATLFWPGSEAAIQGIRPTRWRAFDETVTLEARVETVVGWLSEPLASRPRIATLYFETIDHDSHDHGPDSPQARAAVRAVDAAMGQLIQKLSERGVLDRTNLVIVSDHGMAPVAPGNVVAVEDMVNPLDAEVITAGQSVGFQPRAGRETQAEAQLLGTHPHYSCWRKSEVPARWHYGRHPRVPAIVCQMQEGWDARTRADIARRSSKTTRGSHGYDPALPSMRALFLARGPAFRRGVRLEPFDNVDVYPLLTRLIGIPAAPNDGSPATWTPALRAPTKGAQFAP